MASSSSSSSSSPTTNYYSSRPPTRCTSYDVFWSFRGADTRLGFTDFLYSALVDAGISTFRDNDELEKGETIDPELYKAIHYSRSSVVVLSKDYASSESCLFQLVTILEHKRTSDHIVLPVFYDVDPDTMWGAKGCYEEAFDRHKERFKDDISGKVDRWRAALEEVSELAGMNLKNQADRHEASFIKKIVNVVEDKLRRTHLSETPYLIGIDYQIEQINLWLQGGSFDVGILLICGISGIGKTALAKSVYNSNFNRFEGSAFLENISSEISGRADGLVHLQRKLLSVLTKREVTIHNVSEGTNKIRETIRSKQVILVLDDVNNFEVLEALIGMRDWFRHGSKIIITTKHHTQLLKAREVYKVHVVKQLGENESLELFCWHAFGQNHPIDEHYKLLSLKIVDHCGGLPLALQTLGRSSISWKGIDYWESAIEKLEEIPNGEILGKLRISYDTLQDEHDKNLFLDIACFFNGKEKEFIVAILNECNFHTKIGIQNLIDRYLITIDENNRVRMHCLLRDMGREISRQESPKEPGRRKRLWKSKESFNVLSEKTGDNAIEGLVLHRWNIPSINPNDQIVCLEANGFRKMEKLRLLILGYIHLQRSYESFAKRLKSLISSRGYESFPKGLRWLSWHGFPLDSIPGDFHFQRLIALDMKNSNLKQVWKVPKPLPLLKILNLSYSRQLTETPNFSMLPKLVRIIFCDCVSLVDVHPSISTLKLLETLDISGCSNLTKFPVSEIWKMKSLKVFRANRTPISRWVNTIQEVKPLAIPWPQSLVEVSLANCNLSNNDFPSDFSMLSSLLWLDISENQISELPDCIKSLHGLDRLSFSRCLKLQSIVGLPRVKHLNLTYCESLEKVTLQSASHLPETVGLPEFKNLFEFENWFKLEPIGSIDVNIINKFGLCNLESMQDININITSLAWAGPTKRLPIQGIFEHGLFNIFLPKNEISDYSKFRRNRTDSISLTLPIHPTDILVLNISIIYAVHRHFDASGIFAHMKIQVNNNSKGLKWIYYPTFFGYLDGVKDTVWLSHWNLGNQLEGGDKVTLSVFVDHRSNNSIEVKDLDIKVVCKQEEIQENMSTKECNKNFEVGGNFNFSPDNHEVMPGTYFIMGLFGLNGRDLREAIWRKFEDSVRDKKNRMEEFNDNPEKTIKYLTATVDDDDHTSPITGSPSRRVADHQGTESGSTLTDQ